MAKKTTDRAFEVLKAIKAEVNSDVIKDHEISINYSRIKLHEKLMGNSWQLYVKQLKTIK